MNLLNPKNILHNRKNLEVNKFEGDSAITLAKMKDFNPDILTVLGGPMATSDPELMKEHSGADYLVLGEGAPLACHKVWDSASYPNALGKLS